MYIQLAWRNLWRNKRRTLITAASIFFAVFFALLMRSVQYGAYENMIKNAVGFYTGYIQIQSDAYQEEKSIDHTLTYSNDLIEDLKGIPNVEEIIPRLESGALASIGEISKGVMLVSIDPEKEQHVIDLESKLIEGKYLTNTDSSIIVTEGLAKYFNLSLNDSLILLSQGYHGSSAAGRYIISGIAKFGSPDLNNRLVFMPLPLAYYFFDAKDQVSSYIVKCHNVNKLESTVSAINGQLDDGMAALSWEQMIPQLTQLIEADNAAGIIMILVLYIIIGFGVFGTILMMTNERIYEFGVLISIGMKRWKLIFILILESIFITLIGILGGIIFSIPVLSYFYFNPIWMGDDLKEVSERYDIEPVLHFSLDPEIFWTQGLCVAIIALITIIYPILKISKLKPVEALKG